MDKKTQKELVDNLLITHSILEGENTKAVLEGASELSAAKGVIARLVLIISNQETTEEEGE